jgi:hypothetical protein
VFKPDFRVWQIPSTIYGVVNVRHTLFTFLPRLTMVTRRQSLRQQVLVLQVQAISAAFVMTVIALCYNKQKVPQQLQKSGWRGPARARKRVSIEEIYHSLGPIYFWRSFRMSYESFKKLLGLLTLGIQQLTRKPGTDGSVLQRAPNGMIAPAQRLGCHLRIAAGASVYDVMLVFGIGRADVSKSIWVVTQAINQCRAFDISFLHVTMRKDELQLATTSSRRLTFVAALVL